jgi:GT2 family glycosyltransferase/SAM-dependent methyltransferase/glycosyltransferase involved in cell wall biosynthesis
MNNALICLLWPKNFGALRHYLHNRPRVVLTIQDYCTEELKQLVLESGSTLMPLEGLLDASTRQANDAEAQGKIDAILKQLQAPECADLGAAGGLTQGDMLEIYAPMIKGDLIVGQNIVTVLDAARQRYDIELLMVNEEWLTLSALAIQWAKQRGIPSLHLTHGVGLSRYYNAHKRLQADTIAVLGQRGAESCIDAGVAEDRLRITGNPAWDVYAHLPLRRQEIRDVLSAHHGFPKRAQIVVFATTWAAGMTAFSEPKIYDETIAAVFEACGRLRKAGLELVCVIKDRPSNMEFGPERVAELAAHSGLRPSEYIYTPENTESWLTAADAVVSVDSNVSIEAMLVGVPAVNLITDFGWLMGPSFGVEDGIVEIVPADLASTLQRLHDDRPYRASVLQAQRNRLAYFNHANDGRAAERVAKVMLECARPAEQGAAFGAADIPRRGFAWEELSATAEADLKGAYHDHLRAELLILMGKAPNRVLDIGCAGGATGAKIKEYFPDSQVIGIELNRQAAEIARGRIDLVIDRPLEEVDFASFGIEPHSIDTVIVADVLEHLYDPWAAMIRLRQWLTPDAQILASIPNSRNLWVLNELAHGRFSYEKEGLLDVTHIRFFTREEIEKFFHETGFIIEKWDRTLDGRLEKMELPDNARHVETEKLILKDVSPEEFLDLKTLQHLVVARPMPDEEMLAIRPPEPGQGPTPEEMYRIWTAARQFQDRDAAWLAERMAQWSRLPIFHFGMIVPPGSEEGIGRTLQSLTGQFVNQTWRLTIVAHCALPADTEQSEVIQWLVADADKPALPLLNAALLASDAEWVAMIEAGDKLAPHALFELTDAILRKPDWRLIYTDEDSLADDGSRSNPYFKPDFSIDSVRAAPFAVGGVLLTRQDLFAQLGGFRSELEGAEQWDLILRAYEQIGGAGIGHVADMLYHRAVSGGHCSRPAEVVQAASVDALAEHLERQSLAGEIAEGLLPGTFHVRYRHQAKPKVSIIVPTRNQVEMLQRCVGSIVEFTNWPDWELLVVDNGSDEPEALAYLDKLRQAEPERIKVLSYPKPFNFSAMNNLAAKAASGDYLLLLNNDTAVLQADWLEEMMGYAQQPEVGIVGARLVFPDGKIQHAGVILGIGDSPAEHAFLGCAGDEVGYFGRLKLPQDLSVVTAACLLIRKSVYDAVQGLDEAMFKVSYNDVDLCLKVREQGYRVVWTPHATLLHEGSVSQRGGVEQKQDAAKAERFKGEQQAMYGKWGRLIAYDPFYNRNLSLNTRDFRIEITPALTLDPDWRPRPRILAHPADRFGCGEYRIISPMRQLNQGGLVQGWETGNYVSVPELLRFAPDAVVFQRQIESHQIELIETYIRNLKAFRVYEIDDLITNVPLKSLGRQAFEKLKAAGLNKKFRKAIGLCDRLVVSTQYLADEYGTFNQDVRVVPNYLERARWGELTSTRRQGEKPRVGWAGGVHHTGDLDLIIDVVKETHEEVQWVFFGLCPEVLQPLVEYHHGVDLEEYPKKLASLDLDLAIAPLEDVPFNHAKSHLRLLEYGILGFPVICTDITPYRGDYPVTRVSNKHKDWVDAIRSHVADRDELARMGDRLRDYVKANWMLEDHLDVWLKAWLA